MDDSRHLANYNIPFYRENMQKDAEKENRHRVSPTKLSSTSHGELVFIFMELPFLKLWHENGVLELNEKSKILNTCYDLSKH